MSDQVFMSPNNGVLVVGIPLFRHQSYEMVTHIKDYSIALYSGKPWAYVVDCGDFAQVVSTEFIESEMINLGDL